ncbi:MAG TPA: thiamine biosynthesis protein ApbE [Dysgonomonas sp.]|nr:thiamine biosynthesis protein ApbE [Dysgonomonas sp.]
MTTYFYKVQTKYIFHCHLRIKIPEWYDNSILSHLYDTVEEIDIRYNSYYPGSYFNKINRNAGNFTEVDSQTIDIVKMADRISEFTEGVYDITIMPLIRLWGFYNERKSIPSKKEIDDARPYINYQDIKIQDNKVKISTGQEIITGSFLKAFAVDKLKEKMLDLGITDAIINAGGSTIMAINNDKHQSWKININHPDNKENLFQINISNRCFSTSEQSSYVEIDNKKFGHILNPATGYPSANKQIGLITDNCMTGDMLSTALFNEEGKSFLEKIKRYSQLYDTHIDGFLIDADDKIFFTPDFKSKYISKKISV